MKKISKITLAVVGVLSLMVSPLVITPAVAAESLVAALAEGKASMNIRYRYETVTADDGKEDATASTVRTRLGYTSGSYNDLTAFIEFEDVAVVEVEDYNGTFSTVADPVGSEVNQASLSYAGIEDTTIRFGRQRIILDNARFVGNVGWRQNEQTFDGLSIVNKGQPDMVINYAYLTSVNGITFTETDVESHIVNVKYSGLGAGDLSVYGYFLDEVNTASDSSTIGVRFKGGSDKGMKLMYTVEYAQQSDYADAPAIVDADYMFAEIGTVVNGVKVKLGNEILGGDGVYGFSTPLATKHAFNGWADKFLATGVDGLNDMMFTVAGKYMGTKLKAIYHDFTTDNGSTVLGTELDLLAVKKLSDNTTVGFKYADYSSDSGAADTTKMWLWGQLQF